MQQNCIKCSAAYEEADKDAYYCPSCLITKKQLAAELDAKVAIRKANEPPRPKPRTYEPIPGTDRVEINYRDL